MKNLFLNQNMKNLDLLLETSTGKDISERLLSTSKSDCAFHSEQTEHLRGICHPTKY